MAQNQNGVGAVKTPIGVAQVVRLRDDVEVLHVVISRHGRHEVKTFGKDHGPSEILSTLMRQLRAGVRVIGVETLRNAVPHGASAGADDCWHAIHPDVPAVSTFAFPAWQFEPA